MSSEDSDQTVWILDAHDQMYIFWHWSSICPKSYCLLKCIKKLLMVSDLGQHCLFRPISPDSFCWVNLFKNAFSHVAPYLTHFRLNKLPPQYILEESNLNFSYVRLCDLDIPREKMTNYLQTVEILIWRCILQHLMCVCTVCQLPFWESPDKKVLMS